MARYRKYKRFGCHRARYLTSREVAQFKAAIEATYKKRTAKQQIKRRSAVIEFMEVTEGEAECSM